MSQPDSANPAETRSETESKATSLNVYTVMLIISALSLLIAVLILFIELRVYGNFPIAFTVWKPSG